MDINQENLLQELEAFQKEKEKIQKIVGKIGGKNDVHNKRVNILLCVDKYHCKSSEWNTW